MGEEIDDGAYRVALAKAIENFKDKRIGVVGDIVVDKYMYGRIERDNPETKKPLLKIEKINYVLGGAGNVAANLASLGASVCLLSVIGNDYHGQKIQRLCEENKRIKLIYKFEGETIVKERAIEKPDNYLLRMDFGESQLERISIETENFLFRKLFVEKIDALILSDYNKRMFTNGFGERLIALSDIKKIPSIIDPKPENIKSFVGGTLIRPNIKEAREIVGGHNDGAYNDGDIVSKLLDVTKSKYVAITCGKEGMICSDRERWCKFPSRARNVTDVIGAGDSVAALMALGLISGLDIFQSADLASYAAGIVVEKQGTAVVYPDELVERIMDGSD